MGNKISRARSRSRSGSPAGSPKERKRTGSAYLGWSEEPPPGSPAGSPAASPTTTKRGSSKGSPPQNSAASPTARAALANSFSNSPGSPGSANTHVSNDSIRSVASIIADSFAEPALGKEVELAGHRDAVRCIAANHDGTQIYTGSWDRTIKFWTLKGYEYSCTKTIQAHIQPVCSILVCGSFLFTGSEDKSIKKWHINSGQELLTLRKHTGAVFCLALLNENTLISGGHDKNMHVWNLKNGNNISSLRGHDGGVMCIAVEHPNNNHAARPIVYSGSTDTTIRVWNLARGECTNVWIDGEQGGVNFILLYKNFLLSASHTMIKRWDKVKGVALQSWQAHHDRVYCLCSHDENLYSASNDGNIKCWDLRTPQESKVISSVLGHRPGVLSLLTVESQGMIFSGGCDKLLKGWPFRFAR